MDFYSMKMSLLCLYLLNHGPSCDHRIPENNLPYLHKRPQIRMLLLSALCIGVSVTWMVFRNEDQWVQREKVSDSLFCKCTHLVICMEKKTASHGIQLKICCLHVIVVPCDQVSLSPVNWIFPSQSSKPATSFVWVPCSALKYNWTAQSIDLIHVLTSTFTDNLLTTGEFC